MNPNRLCLAFVALTFAACAREPEVAAPSAASAAPPAVSAEPQFAALFAQEGPVTQGWLVRHWEDVSKPPRIPVTWDVIDGVLHGTGRHSPGHTSDTWVGTWLLSEREYGDFILELEFKFKNGGQFGNGGVALRAPLTGDPAYDGMELQITDRRFETKYFPDAGEDEMTGALYLIKAADRDVYKPDDWNQYRIEMRGPKVKVTLNGVVIQDIDLDNFAQPARKHGEGMAFLPATPGKDRPRRGHIGFQDLGEARETLMFRNVRIAVLD